jgi:hypothetical protein
MLPAIGLKPWYGGKNEPLLNIEYLLIIIYEIA